MTTNDVKNKIFVLFEMVKNAEKGVKGGVIIYTEEEKQNLIFETQMYTGVKIELLHDRDIFYKVKILE